MIVDEAPTAAVVGDVCVVGGGPAGIAIALRLAEAGAQVVLLESGGSRFEPEAQEFARAETIGSAYFPVHETRIRALGGSTWSWGGVCTPLDAEALPDRDWVPNGGWPIGDAELRPYLDDALALCGIPPEARRAADEQASSRFNAAQLDPTQVAPVPVYFSRPTRFGLEYFERLAGSRNLTVRLHSTLTGLRLARRGVECLDASWRRTAFQVTAGTYVLACGGIENARLLLASGVGGPAVGRHFMEHPRVLDRFPVRPGSTPLADLVGDGIGGGLRFLRLSTAPEVQRTEGLLTSHANLQFGYAGQEGETWVAMRRLLIAFRRPWNESPYYQDAGGGRLRPRAADVAAVLRRPDRAFLGTLGAVSGMPQLRRSLEVWTAVEQPPLPENRVELSTRRDPLGVPRAVIRWTVGVAEERTYRRTREVLAEALDHLEPGLAATGRGDGWAQRIVGNWHHEGTTRMNGDPARGVVDSDCRVHGLRNLYVAGSSVFPTSGSTSPTLTILQLSLRLADHLTGRRGPQGGRRAGERGSTAPA